MECLFYLVNLLCVELTCLAALSQFGFILEGCWLVKTMLKSFADHHVGG